MQTGLKKCPFKGTSKLSKPFDMILRGHERASGVSYPSKQISVGYHAPVSKFLQCISGTEEYGRNVALPRNTELPHFLKIGRDRGCDVITSLITTSLTVKNDF